MDSSQDPTPVNTKEKREKGDQIQPKIVTVKEESPKKYDKSKLNDEEPKPRIVLTFRSEKPGIKSSNMKIVSTEEKHEETTVRRSTRTHGADDHDDEASTSKTSVYESDDATSDTSSTTPKRSVRNRNKDHGDNIIASAIARKEKSYNEATPSPAPSQRLSRRIKPTAKILANKELRIGLETQNNVRLGITAPTDKSPEEGVQTRRSLRRRSPEASISDNSLKMVSPGEITPKKRKVQKEEPEPKVAIEISPAIKEQEVRLNKMKKKHLSKLGLQAIEGEPREANEESQSMDSTNTEAVAEHLNAQNEAMDEDIEEMDEDGHDTEDEDLEEELAEMDEEWPDHSGDEDFIPATRRSLRSTHSESKSSNHADSLDEHKEPPRRRSTRLRRPHFETSSPYASEHSDVEAPEEIPPPEGSPGSEAACPDERPAVLGACVCEAASNVYAAPSELEEPVFCRAIEASPSGRVGCSHPARRAGASYAPLLRAGPRTPYALLCDLHTSCLRQHMCCTTCGLFCTQGIFYRCSLGHFFHLDCGLSPAAKLAPGCPHCGLLSYQWQRPANRDCFKVKLDMKCNSKRIVLQEQRVQSQPAYLSFSTLDPSQLDHEPYIPEDLLPKPPIDIKSLKAQLSGTNGELPSADSELKLRDAIVNFETSEELISKIMSVDVNKACDGDSYLHLAAQSGNLAAVYLLQYAGADLNAQDGAARTPLMAAIAALLEKSPKKSTDKSSKASPEKDKDTDSVSSQEKEDKESERDSMMDTDDVIKAASEENLMKVIRYLVAAGCDVNVAGPEGMTALHLAAQWGGRAVAAAILSSAAAAVDARDHGGWTPLVWAAENNHPAVLTTLLSAGAEPAATDAEGNSALHWCALAGAAACLRLLADTGADVSAPNVHSDTPLHVAARQGHYSCVVILLARGARTDIENVAGELAVEVCRAESQSAISLHMQLALTVRDHTKRFKLITSDISNGHESFPIPCVNEVDDSAPEPFTYVTRHVMPSHIPVDNTLPTMQGCNCAGADCSASACSCAAVSVRRWWGGGGRLLPCFPYHEPPMIFECNYTCACRLKHCTNTTITRLSALGATFVRSVVFKRRVGGWGLRAARALPRGAPAAAYIGELLPADEADTRTMDQYMFGLHLKPTHIEQCIEKTQLCVDAAAYGSAARFINHSCRPNLAPVRVFTSTRDLRLPTITLFATRDIATNEELTFDYGDKFWSVKAKFFKCECGEPECRYPKVTQDDSKSETVEN